MLTTVAKVYVTRHVVAVSYNGRKQFLISEKADICEGRFITDSSRIGYYMIFQI